MAFISSLQNATVKELVRLRESSKERKSQKKFIIEGAREWERALRSGYVCEAVYYCAEILSVSARKVFADYSGIAKVEVASAVFSKLAVREGSDGIIALMQARSFSKRDIQSQRKKLFLALDQLEKPGNFGALTRTADGAGVDGIFVLDPNADLYNPHAIRASVGALFSQPLYALSHTDFLDFCKDFDIKIVTASPDADRMYFEENLAVDLALVLGSEAHGLSDFWSKVSHVPLKIPMLGIADSLNVSVAGAIILYESLRQRT